MDVGFWSVVPPLLTIVLAIITKEVLLSLFIGVYTGCLIIAEWNPLGAMHTMMETLVGTYGEGDHADYVSSGALTDPWNVQVLIIIVMLGGLIGLLVRSGGSKAFAELISSKIKTKKGAQAATWLIGMLIFFDDYFDSLTTGSIMRPVNDKFGISREKTSYIVDSTCVGICLIVPLSSWIAFVCSLIGDAYKTSGIEGNPFNEFLRTIPHNYYAWLSLFMVLIVVFLNLDFGPMAKAEKRTKETGIVCDKTFSGGGADEDDFSAIEPSKGGAWALLAPIITLVILAMVFMLYTGGFFSSWSLLDAVNNMDGMLALTFAICITVVLSIILYSVTKLSKVTDLMSAFVVGSKSMMFVIFLLAFSWSIGMIGDKLDTAGYVVSLFADNVPGAVIPLIVFVFACAMTFATGAAWGTYAIMVPLAVPLAVSMDASVITCVAAVLGGGGFGAHCSPLADTAILSSASCNIRHTDHIKTQIPYSVSCAFCASIGYLVSGFMDNWIIPLAVTFGSFLVVVFILNRLFGEHRQKLDAVSEDAIVMENDKD